MTDDAIPQRALDEAVKRLNATMDDKITASKVLARMIAKHERPPVDPDEEAVKRILCAALPSHAFTSGVLAAALAQYKKEIGRD